jgi:hypothetical protein
LPIHYLYDSRYWKMWVNPDAAPLQKFG